MIDVGSRQADNELSAEQIALSERESARAHYRARRAWPAFRLAERNEPWTEFGPGIALRLLQVRSRLLKADGVSDTTLYFLVAAISFLPLSIAIHTLERLDRDDTLIERALSLPDNLFTKVLRARLRFLWRMQVLSRIFSPDRRALVLRAIDPDSQDGGHHE